MNGWDRNDSVDLWMVPIGRSTYEDTGGIECDGSRLCDFLTALCCSYCLFQHKLKPSALKHGTLFTRIWGGSGAPSVGPNTSIEMIVQRNPDQGAAACEAVPFGLTATVTMPGETRIYERGGLGR